MGEYWYVIVVIILAISAFVLVYLVQSRPGGQERSWLSYFLVWPLVLDVDKSKRAGQFLTRREWLGWAIVGLFIAVGMFVSSR